MNDLIDSYITNTIRNTTASPGATRAIDKALAALKRPNDSAAEASHVASATRRSKAMPIRSFAWSRVAAAAIVVSLSIGGSAFAAEKLGLIDLQRLGDYQIMLAFNAGDPAKEPIEDFRLEFTDLPADAREIERTDHLAKYHWNDDKSAFTATVFYLDSDEAMPISFTTDGTLVDIEGHEGVVFEKPNVAENKTAYDFFIAYPDQDRVLWLWSESLSSDELAKVASCAKLIPNGKQITPGIYQDKDNADDHLMNWSDMITSRHQLAEAYQDRLGNEEMKLSASAEEMSNLHHVGELFAIKSYAHASQEYAEGAFVASVTNLEVSDDLSLLDDEHTPEAWRTLIGENGKLEKTTLRHMAFGDGRDTLDTIVAEEEVELKLVKVRVSYTNTGTTAFKELPVVATLLRADESDKNWSVFDRKDTVAGSHAIVCQIPGIIPDGAPQYYMIDQAHRGEKNSLSHLKPGESAMVEYAWLVPVDELDKILLNLDARGICFSFDEADLEQGYVDIRQSS